MNFRLTFRPLFAAASIAFTVVGLHAAEAGVEFTGYMRDDKGLVIALREKATGGSKWVSLGQEYAGYTARSLDENEKVLVVVRDKVEYRLPLTLSKIRQVAMEPPAALKKKVMNNLRQLSAAADQYFLENGVSMTTFDKLVGPTLYVKEINAADGENYRDLKFQQGRKIEVTTNAGFVFSYAP